MTEPKPETPPPNPRAAERLARQAAALRDNLRRRKEQPRPTPPAKQPPKPQG